MTTLYINRSDSRCGKCGRNADPIEKAHRMGRMIGEGCGAKYTSVSSHYYGEDIKRVTCAMRPDLPWIDLGTTPEPDAEDDTLLEVRDERAFTEIPF